MNCRCSYPWGAGFGTLLSVLLATTSCATAEKGEGVSAGAELERPNIIYIMADDLGYADLSSYGRTDYETPNLDRLAAEGTRFTQAYAIAPLCTPTRVGLMTGRYPARSPTGLWEPLTGEGDADQGLGIDPPTLSMLLKAAGYNTGLFGKWHLGWRPEFQPKAHGFDVSFGPLGGAIDYISHSTGSPSGVTKEREHDLYMNGEEEHRDGYITDHFTEEAVTFLRQATPPFFLSMQYTAPHWPWQRRGDEPYPEGWHWVRDGGSPETYAKMVRVLDQGVGRILETLGALGHTEDTLVIFTSDNGGERWSDMGPFRGQKIELWEGGIRVPAFVRWPGVIPAGSSTDQVVTTLDWTATMLAAAGLTLPAELDGMDILPHLKGKAPLEERTVFWRSYQRRRHKAVRSGHWKYLNIEPLGGTDQDVAGEYLFDLAEDPSEEHDLKADERQVFESLKALYAEWEAEVLEPTPLPSR